MNVSKTQFTIFGETEAEREQRRQQRTQNNIDPNYGPFKAGATFNETTQQYEQLPTSSYIEEVEQYKYLGLWIKRSGIHGNQKEIDWKIHRQKMITKAKQAKYNIVRRGAIKGELNLNIGIQLYRTYVASTYQYLMPFWCDEKTLKKIQKIQSRCLKTLFTPYDTEIQHTNRTISKHCGIPPPSATIAHTAITLISQIRHMTAMTPCKLAHYEACYQEQTLQYNAAPNRCHKCERSWMLGTNHLQEHLKRCTYFGYITVEQKALNIIDNRTQHSTLNPHIHSWETFDIALSPPQKRSRLTSQEIQQWRIKQHLFIDQLDLDLLFPTPLLPLVNGKDPVSSCETYRRTFQPKVTLQTTPWQKVIQPHWSIRTFSHIDIRDIICLFTGHTHMMAHNPIIAKESTNRVCDICMVTGQGLHYGTAHHLLNGCSIPELTQLRQQLDHAVTVLCHKINKKWQKSTHNPNTKPFHWTTFNSNKQHWAAAIALSENAPCFQTARKHTTSSNYSDKLWSPIVAEIATFVTEALRIHRQYHNITHALRTNATTWTRSIDIQTNKYNYTTTHHTTFFSD
jgi:hypothetical protein